MRGGTGRPRNVWVVQYDARERSDVGLKSDFFHTGRKGTTPRPHGMDGPDRPPAKHRYEAIGRAKQGVGMHTMMGPTQLMNGVQPLTGPRHGVDQCMEGDGLLLPLRQ